MYSCKYCIRTWFEGLCSLDLKLCIFGFIVGVGFLGFKFLFYEFGFLAFLQSRGLAFGSSGKFRNWSLLQRDRL